VIYQLLFNFAPMEKQTMLNEPVDNFTDTFFFQVMRLRKAIFRRSGQLINESNISLKIEQLPFMMILQRHPGLSQRELSEITLRDKSSVLRSISVLEKKQLITIEQDAVDKRRNNITLNKEGEALATKIRSLMKDAEDDVLSVFSPEERKEAFNTLKGYANKLERQ